MKFTDRTKKIVCICLAAAMIVPIAVSAIFMLYGV